MQFDIITIFPEIFDSYFSESIIKRAQEKGKVKIKIWNLRDFTKDKHKKVDDRPFGGGPGMVMKIEPLIRCIQKIVTHPLKSPSLKVREGEGGRVIFNSKFKKTLIILFSASGKQFDAKLSRNFAKKQNRIIMICGHYEGIDERIIKIIENWKLKIVKLSVGPYVLTGGELPAMVVLDSIARQIPGVLGKAESLEESRHGIGVPVYTRPEIFSARGGSAFGGKYKNKKYAVPKVLLSGNHKKIDEWREKHKK